jgi:hypothetical protein
MIYRLEKDNKFILIGSKASRLDRQHIESEIEPGKYLIAVHFPKELNKYLVDSDEYLNSKEMINDKITFRIGFYSPLNQVRFNELEDGPNYFEMLHRLALQLSEENKLKEIFYQEGEPDTWRCLDFSEDIQSVGFLAYHNMSQAVIREKLTLTSFVNVRIIPLLNNFNNSEGSSDQSEEIIEDEYENVIFTALRNHLNKSKSTLNHHLLNPRKKEVSEENPLNVEISIAPMSTAVLLIEKYDEFASIKASSEINMVYPVDYVLSERKFNGKKSRIRYKNDFINIFENVIKFPTGVIFKYKNKTKEYKIEINITFETLDNLMINRNYDNVYEIMNSQFKKLDNLQIDEFSYNTVTIDSVNSKAKIVLYPNQCAFVEAVSINPYKEYSFKTNFDYNISISDLFLSSKFK